MKYRKRDVASILFVALFSAAVFLLSVSRSASAAPFPGEEKVRHVRVLERASRGETQDLIVVFEEKDAVQQAASLRALSGAAQDTPDILREKSRIFRNKKQEVLNFLTTDDAEALADYDQLPLMFLRVKSRQAVERLAAQPGVMGIYENQQYFLTLSQSLPLIGQPEVANTGYTGSGTAVAVLDTGVDYTRPAFGSCMGGNVPGDCLLLPPAPTGCRVACVHDFATDDNSLDDDDHGTNVSGIVSGVAPGTRVLGLDVFECVDSQCNPAPCNGKNFAACSDRIINAVNWTIANKAAYNIAAMNMSFGGGSSDTTCDGDLFAGPIALARSAGILSAVASGNSYLTDMLSSPACVPAAVSVGAVYDGGPGTPPNSTDRVTPFSNSADFLAMLAPGSYITAAGISMQGTSQAAPHIAGSIAVLKGAFPSETPDQTVARMVSTGKQIRDPRNNIATSRIDLEAAVNGTLSSYMITGKVVTDDGFPVEDVTLNLTGDASETAVSDFNGFYHFSGISNGSYTITPSFDNAAFAPASVTLTVTGASTNVPTFRMTQFSIRGKIRNVFGRPLPDVTVTLGGDGSGIAVTDSDGRYIFSGQGNGIYTVTPGKTGYSFIPPAKTIQVADADQKGENFTSVTYAIKGYVRNASGSPMAGVTVSLAGDATLTRTTDINGHYRFGNLPEGNFVVTPGKAGKIFEPAFRNVTISGASEKLQSFKAAP